MSDYLYDCARRLIGFDTVSVKSARAAMEYIASELERARFTVARQPVELLRVEHENLLAWLGPPRPDGLIISGHIDTVPFEGQPGWTRLPLKLDVDGDRIFARGTSDMKCFIAGCLDAVRELDVARLARPLVFVFTVCEEVGCLGAREVAPALKQILGEHPAPKLAWIGEPTSYRVAHAHKSIVSFEVRVRGAGGHSGAPHEGVNAIAVMGKVIAAIGRVQEERRHTGAPPEFRAIFPDAPHDVLNFGTIRGGLAGNIIAEECVLHVSYRSLPGADPLALYREIESRLAALDPHDYASERRRAAIELGRPNVVPPLSSPRGTSLERALFAATGAAESGGVLFGTDGGWFAGSAIDSLICGPGDLDQAHQPNESIRRDPFERTPAIVRDVIARMCMNSP